jgi:hypothetical protein
VSFRGLDVAGRRLFRRLGLLDVPDFAAWVAAALLDSSVAGPGSSPSGWWTPGYWRWSAATPAA